MSKAAHDIITAFEGMGILGLLKLLWVLGGKFFSWWPSYVKGEKQAALDVRKVIVDENKVTLNAHEAEAARVQTARDGVDSNLFALIGTLKGELERVVGKVDRLEGQLAAEIEARKLANVSTDVAHARADDLDRDRAKAVLEVAELRRQNHNLTALLADADGRLQRADERNAKDRIRIDELTGLIEENRMKIEGLETKLAQFQHGSFLMSPGTVELTHVDTPGETT